MNMGLEISPNVFISYRRISLVKKVSEGDSYEVTLTDGQKLRFNDRSKFERIKNFLTKGHPVEDQKGRQ